MTDRRNRYSSYDNAYGYDDYYDNASRRSHYRSLHNADTRYDGYSDGYADGYAGGYAGSYSDRAQRTARLDSRSSNRAASDYSSASRTSRGYSQNRQSPYSGSRRSDSHDGYPFDENTQYRQAPSRRSPGYHSDGAASSRRYPAANAEPVQAASAQRSARRETPTSTRQAPAGGRHAAHSQDYQDEMRYASKKKSNLKRNLLVAGVIVVVVLLAGVGAAFAYLNNISNNMHENLDENVTEALTPTDLAGEPFYMLLLGTDTSADRVENDPMGDSVRSDSMILARIDPQNKKVSLISIHRDTMVEIEGYGEQKINFAYQVGGAAGAIEAVSKLAGVPISHYASIDFDGFRAMVDTLGGVEVEVPMEIDDELAGGHLDAGLQTLNGEQALILCRARHAYDDVATDGDVMRAANQRVVLGAIAKKVLASDIGTIANTVQAMSNYVTTDLNITDIVGLAQLMRGIDPAADIYTAMEPTVSEYVDDVWYERLDEEAWQKMISRMDEGLAPVDKNEVDDATGTVLSTSGTDAPTV